MFRRWALLQSPEVESTGGGEAAAPVENNSGFSNSALEQYGLSGDDFKDQPLDVESEKTSTVENNTELTPEQMLEKLAQDGEQGATDQPLNAESGLLDLVNKMEFKHEGNSFKVNDENHLKELVQKGYDYTANMQSLKQEQTEIEQMLEQRVSAFEQQYQQHQEFNQNAEKFDYALQRMKASNPDLHEQVLEFVSGVQGEIENPYLKGITERLTRTEQTLQKKIQELESRSIVSDFDKDKAQFSPKIEKTIEKLGLKVDWDKVKSQWSKSDGESVEKAFYAVCGKEIADRYASRMNVDQAKTKAAAAKNSRGIGSAGRATQSKTPVDISKMNEHDAAYALAEEYRQN